MKKLISSILFISFVFVFAAAFITNSSVATSVETKAKKAGVFVPKGYDTFETTDNGETVSDFSETPIPRDFFGRDSLPYKGTVVLKGKPLPEYGDKNIDTVVVRETGGYAPFRTVLSVKSLSLESSCPITVVYRDGSTEKWDVSVGLSSSARSGGTMTFYEDETFESTLELYPVFIFTKSDRSNSASAAEVKTLDTGSPLVQMYLKSLRTNENKAEANAGNAREPIITAAVKLVSPRASFKISQGNLYIPVPIIHRGPRHSHFVVNIPIFQF